MSATIKRVGAKKRCHPRRRPRLIGRVKREGPRSANVNEFRNPSLHGCRIVTGVFSE